ncbi:ABC transporter ATP-binding protein [Deinococcus cellulosilyticus]|uniref:ABC transporter ATP-binding protein n=1 Tax=Deinococcus cellulosilyticus (strain DSM 18568 / NBRC 106333 / KACC 11606 / 5516J-15) TaxID=1223518 RepID=A0A511N2S9_DEIC1|nr:ABC transporter ATP-binding protein [Deinococcus cellulosilyticus]GEM47160.1 ABC transporter ATP-binding protein [Deinococcus cellulosilyticus NBRC 106333 = KACC 11606]
MILEVRGLQKSFGGLMAVKDMGLHLDQGEILAVIGPNGAGKTTLLNLLSGLFLPDAGQITLAGHDITRATPERRCHLGIGRAFQVVRPFLEMTVFENVMVGAMFGKHGVSKAEAWKHTEQVLHLTGLEQHAHKNAHDLTLMQDKRLEVARALATRPSVLLLDEVMAGLRPNEAQDAVQLVKSVRDSGVSVLFIEHVMPVVRDLADRVVVMEYGSKLAEGTYQSVVRDPRVVAAYLGEEGA